MGVNNNKKLKEASGLAASIRYPGFLWTLNDSGHPADLFLLDSTAATNHVFRLSKIENRDWEDIAIGPGPEAGVNYIYVGEIGDNDQRYPLKYIYRFPEPSVDQGGVIQDFDTLVVRLSDQVRDTEALMVDPVTKNLYLVSKREETVGLYEISFPFNQDTLTAIRVASLPLKTIVAADISPDGQARARKLFAQVLDAPGGGLQIMTIHSFCQSLLSCYATPNRERHPNVAPPFGRGHFHERNH